MHRNHNSPRNALLIVSALCVVSLTSFFLIFHFDDFTASNLFPGSNSSDNSSGFPIPGKIASYLPNPSTQVAQLIGANSGLVGWWKLDEGSGTLVADSSVSGNNGTLVGSPLPSWTTGQNQAGKAVQFSNVKAQGIVVKDSVSLNPAQITISFWIKVPDTLNTFRIFDKSNEFIIRASGGVMQMIKGVFFESSAKYQANTWEHWVFTGASDSRWYRNGVLAGVSPTAWTATSGGGDLKLSGSLDQFTGAIDDVRIYNRALRADEVQSLAQNTGDISGNPPPPNPPSSGSNPPPAQASGNIYIAQSSVGTDSGSDCANAHSVNWLNTQANWAASGTGKIIPGTTVHLCGTITNGISFLGSGTTGNLITLYFEAGAKMSQSAGTSFIGTSGQSYIVIDGGSSGIIENMANGSAPTYPNQVSYRAVDISGSNNIEIKNLHFRTLYVHNNTADQASFSNTPHAIYDNGLGSNVRIHDNSFSDTCWSITLLGANPGASGAYIYNNTFDRYDHGVSFGGNNGYTNINIYNNHFGSTANWDTTSNMWHHDGIHIYLSSPYATSVVSGIYIYNNLFDGDWGINNTAYIFTEDRSASTDSGGIRDTYVYNNVFITTRGKINNGKAVALTHNSHLYNNTFIGSGSSDICVGMGDLSQSVTFQNNLVTSCSFLINNGLSGSPSTNSLVDYNLYANGFDTNQFQFNGIFTNSFSSWQRMSGSDSHSAYSASALQDSTGTLKSGSPAIGTGANLTSKCASLPGLCKDYLGNPRPTTGAWDIGAYKYTGTITQPPSNTGSIYYVDFAGGSDTNDGASTATPWKHAPGDTNATGKALAVKLQPGNKVIFKGGVVYIGMIAIPESGTSGNPIIYSGTSNWGSGKAIIEGSDPVSGWQRCTSQAACGGNQNWSNIYFSKIKTITTTDPALSLNLHQGNQPLTISQYPLSGNKYYETKENFLSIAPANVTATSISDSRLAGMGGSSLVGSYVYMWVNPNEITVRKIISYSANTISFDSANVYSERDTLYALANNMNSIILNSQGQYYLSPIVNSDGTYNIYVWPNDVAGMNALTNPIMTASRATGIDVNNKSYVTIDGFVIRGQSGATYSRGAAIIKGSSSQTSGISVLNNEISLTFIADGASILMSSLSGAVIDGNYLHDTLGNGRGIQTLGNNVTVSNNILDNVARTPIYFGGNTNSVITGNTVKNSVSTHSNGISVYQNSSNITVSKNYVTNSNIAFTFEQSSNLSIFNNVFDGSGKVGYVVAEWGGQTGINNIFNNIVTGSNNNHSLFLGSKNTTYNIKNNILDNSPLLGAGFSSSNNLFLGSDTTPDKSDVFVRAPRIEAGVYHLDYLETVHIGGYKDVAKIGDYIVFDSDLSHPRQIISTSYGIYKGNYATAITFSPPLASLSASTVSVWKDTNFSVDYHSKSNSPALDAGVSLSSYFTTDISGTYRPQGSGWDIGAYESSGSGGGGQTSGGGDTSANYHPADTSRDARITLSEIQAYALCWKTSGCIWSVGPNPILQTYINIAAFIYKSGEVYHYNTINSCPNCYVKGL